MRVAILGTGKMGGAMARRLDSAGYQLTLWNRTRERAEALGQVRRVGDLGNAASLKLVANSMTAGVTALAAELQSAGTAAGLNPEDVFWVMTRVAPGLSARKAGFVEHRYEPVTFALRDALKDVRLAADLYGRSGSTTPLTSTVKELYERATRSAGGLDISAISTIYDGQPAEVKRS